jgi:hypothetical protein
MKTAMLTTLLLTLGTALAAPESDQRFVHQPATTSGTVWQGGRPVGSYTTTDNGGWTCRDGGKVTATYTPNGASGGTLWQDGRPVGSYSTNANGGWTYREGGRVVATYTPSANGGTVWQGGRPVGQYTTSVNGSWTYREGGKIVANFTPIASAGKPAADRTTKQDKAPVKPGATPSR